MIAANVWKKITKVCQVEVGDKLTPVTLVALPLVAGADKPSKFQLQAFTRAWTKLFTEELTEADKLNGLQYHGYARLSGPTVRIYGWRKWDNWIDNSDNEAEKKSSKAMGLGSWFKIEKRNGKWIFGFMTEFDPDEVDANMPSCDVLKE